MKYRYATQYRMPDFVTAPPGFEIVERGPQFPLPLRTDLPMGKHPFGVIAYDKLLSFEAVQDFQLTPLPPPGPAGPLQGIGGRVLTDIYNRVVAIVVPRGNESHRNETILPVEADEYARLIQKTMNERVAKKRERDELLAKVEKLSGALRTFGCQKHNRAWGGCTEEDPCVVCSALEGKLR